MSVQTVSERERAKYAQIWTLPQYSENSPGLAMIEPFLEIVRPKPHAAIVDVGCGSGAASRVLADEGYTVFPFDLTNAAWKHDDLPLTTGSIWRDGVPGNVDHAFCCDVMEHIPTEFVGLSLYRTLQAAPSAFFSISFEPDSFGAFLREPLHLTVKPFEWWLGVLGEVGTIADARDLMGEGVFHVKRGRA